MIEYTFKKVTTARALAGRQPTVCAHSTRSALSRTAYSEAHGVLPLTVSALYSASHASICMSGVRTHAVQIDFQKKNRHSLDNGAPSDVFFSLLEVENIDCRCSLHHSSARLPTL